MTISMHAIKCLQAEFVTKLMIIRDVKRQELRYRKQIARQLRTQHVEGTPKYYTVTLKSRLKVTQGHWKLNHLIIVHDFLLVELFDVECYPYFVMWVRGHSRSLKVVPFKSFGTVSYRLP